MVLLWVGGSLLIASGSAASASYEFSSAASGTGTFIGTFLACLFVGIVPSFFHLVFGRVVLELLVANVRTARNTSKLVNAEQK